MVKRHLCWWLRLRCRVAVGEERVYLLRVRDPLLQLLFISRQLGPQQPAGRVLIFLVGSVPALPSCGSLFFADWCMVHGMAWLLPMFVAFRSCIEWLPLREKIM